MDQRRVARVVLATAAAPTLLAQGARAVVNGFWLGVLSDESLRALDQRYYDQTDLYRTEEWNERGLFGWERDLVDRYFPTGGRVAVAACGGGREVLALCRAGFHVHGFEPHPALTAFAARFLEAHGEPGRIHTSGRDELPDGSGPYDAVVVGWGAYSLIHGRDRRVAFLDQLHRQLPPGAPVLLSFFDRDRDHRELRWTLGLAKRLRRVVRSNGVAPELGDTLSPTRVHVFSRRELRDELETAGFEVATHLTIGAAEVTTSYAAAVALARR